MVRVLGPVAREWGPLRVQMRMPAPGNGYCLCVVESAWPADGRTDPEAATQGHYRRTSGFCNTRWVKVASRDFSFFNTLIYLLLLLVGKL